MEDVNARVDEANDVLEQERTSRRMSIITITNQQLDRRPQTRWEYKLAATDRQTDRRTDSSGLHRSSKIGVTVVVKIQRAASTGIRN